MAISKDKKQQLVADLNELLSDAKMTVLQNTKALRSRKCKNSVNLLAKTTSKLRLSKTASYV